MNHQEYRSLKTTTSHAITCWIFILRTFDPSLLTYPYPHSSIAALSVSSYSLGTITALLNYLKIATPTKSSQENPGDGTNTEPPLALHSLGEILEKSESLP